MQIIRIAILLITVCCAGPTVVSLSQDYETLRGKIVGDPSLESDGERLFIYLQIESEVEEKKKIVTCLATNSEEKIILSETRSLILNALNEPVFLYVSKSEGPHEEIISGVEYMIHAVGVYIPDSGKYRVILTGYGEGLRAALADISWSEFLRSLVKRAASGG